MGLKSSQTIKGKRKSKIREQGNSETKRSGLGGGEV